MSVEHVALAAACVAVALLLAPTLTRLIEQCRRRPIGVTPHRSGSRIVAVVTAVGFAATALRFGLSAQLLAYLFLVALLVVLSFVDLATKTLPRRLVHIALIGGIVLLVPIGALAGEPERMMWATVGALGAFVVLTVLHLVARGGFGFGDVRSVRCSAGTWRGRDCGTSPSGCSSPSSSSAFTGLALMALGRAGTPYRDPLRAVPRTRGGHRPGRRTGIRQRRIAPPLSHNPPTSESLSCAVNGRSSSCPPRSSPSPSASPGCPEPPVPTRARHPSRPRTTRLRQPRPRRATRPTPEPPADTADDGRAGGAEKDDTPREPEPAVAEPPAATADSTPETTVATPAPEPVAVEPVVADVPAAEAHAHATSTPPVTTAPPADSRARCRMTTSSSTTPAPPCPTRWSFDPSPSRCSAQCSTPTTGAIAVTAALVATRAPT